MVALSGHGGGPSEGVRLSPVEPSDVSRAQEAIGYRFRDPSLLSRALTHASIADSRLASNERLEFLGDAILGTIVCDYLFQRFPDLLEGDLTKIKSTVVSRRTCSALAIELGLEELLALGKGMKTRTALPASLSAAVIEAVVGAIYLDGGMDAARSFLMPLLEPVIERAAESGHQQNFKSVLQQHAQRELMAQPSYVMLDDKGPDHAKAFHICVEIDGRRFPGCWATSKKQAEQQAALAALNELGLMKTLDDGHVIYAPSSPNGSHESAA
ncbi:MAG: ribonuclease III [Phycisphaeraceae bacterium]|nr:ribonuclease III [Phycisphaeraceae bacterium]